MIEPLLPNKLQGVRPFVGQVRQHEGQSVPANWARIQAGWRHRVVGRDRQMLGLHPGAGWRGTDDDRHVDPTDGGRGGQRCDGLKTD